MLKRVAVSVGILMAAVVPGSSSVEALAYDGTNPQGTCNTSVHTPFTRKLRNSYTGQYTQAWVDLRWSGSCGTAWGRVRSGLSACQPAVDYCGNAGVTRTKNSWEYLHVGCLWGTQCQQSGKTVWWSGQVYDNGGRLAHAEGDIGNGPWVYTRSTPSY